MKLLRIVLGVLGVLALASAAAADDIVRLDGPVTDRTNAHVLASGDQRIRTAIADLLRVDDVQLFVLFVETTSGRTVTDYADETARVNSLGGNDALLVVALTDRSDALWRSGAYLDRLTDNELQTVLTQQVEPRLRAGDYVGAVIGAIDGIGAASRSRSGAATPAPTGSLTAPDLGFVVPLVLVIAGALLLWNVFATRRRERVEQAARARRDAQRAQEANALLIRADESLRDAQQEMGYAEAQFTPDEVAPYRDAVAAASTELKAAFTIRQKLDDDVPEDADTRRRFVEELVAHATKALALLDEQRKRVEEMRELERRAPELLAQLSEQAAAASARVPDAERTVAGFARYAEPSWSSVKSNVADARELLTKATDHVSDGQAAATAGDAAKAAKAVRDAQQDLDEAVRLLDAIGAVAAAIEEARRTARDHVAASAADVEKAAAAIGREGGAERERRLAGAREALANAEKAMSADAPDFIAAVKLAAAAGSGAGAVLAEVREEEQRREREMRLATTQLQVARDAYRRAADYIAPRRRTIRSTPRTRLTEAERHLASAEQAMRAGDHGAAAADAQRAQRLADEAWSLAQEDVREAESEGPWTGFPRGGPVIVPFPFPMGGGHSHGGGGGWRPPISIQRPGGSVGGRW